MLPKTRLAPMPANPAALPKALEGTRRSLNFFLTSSFCSLICAHAHLCQHNADVQQSKVPLGCADMTDIVCTPCTCLWGSSEQSNAKLTWSLWRLSLSLCLCCINLRYSACALCGALAGGGSGAAAACVASPKLDPESVG